MEYESHSNNSSIGNYDNLKSSSELKTNFFLLSDINLNVRVKIIKFEGNLNIPSISENPEIIHTEFYNSECKDLYLTCGLYSDGKPLVPIMRTSFCHANFRWNRWFVLPLKYKDLPHSSQLVFNIWNIKSPSKEVIVGGTTISLFNKDLILRKGRIRLHVWNDVEADYSPSNRTPGKGKHTELDKVDKRFYKFKRNEIPKCEWLDNLTLTKIRDMKRLREKNLKEFSLYIEFPIFPYSVIYHEKGIPRTLNGERTIVSIYDPELVLKMENPIAVKQFKLLSQNWRKYLDPNLRPSLEERDRIESILRYPVSTKLSMEEKDLFWKYRIFLASNKRALTKFLKCVDWENPQESKEANELIQKWEPIEVSDALELLSKSYQSPIVRYYAVSRLETASNEEIKDYLLPLVQALRYEEESTQISKLMAFLIQRANADPSIQHFFYWYLRVESEDVKYKSFYQLRLAQFMANISKLENSKAIKSNYTRQEAMITCLCSIYKELRSSRANRKKKAKMFQEFLSSNGLYRQVGTFPEGPLPFPLDPRFNVLGINPDKIKIFSSSLEPLGIEFKTAEPDKSYMVIFKSGDDLRQDQVIIQLIQLMDKLLKRENLDLKLTPYRVLATSNKDGMVEWVQPSYTLAAILKEYGNDLHNFFKKYNSDESGPYGIRSDVINTFVRSCAGYCVITYILCVGDRHLDNLLLTPSGNLFHIDFGFICRDPKPYPPPMKLCSEMVAAMGGQESPHFKLFTTFCVEAFNILRKNSNLILNLISLMVDSNIADLANEKCFLQIQSKFQLDKNDEQAGDILKMLMQESVTALFPRLSEKIHKWRQYWDTAGDENK